LNVPPNLLLLLKGKACRIQFSTAPFTLRDRVINNDRRVLYQSVEIHQTSVWSCGKRYTDETWRMCIFPQLLCPVKRRWCSSGVGWILLLLIATTTTTCRCWGCGYGYFPFWGMEKMTDDIVV
jgi:hypothetical protein